MAHPIRHALEIGWPTLITYSSACVSYSKSSNREREGERGGKSSMTRWAPKGGAIGRPRKRGGRFDPLYEMRNINRNKERETEREEEEEEEEEEEVLMEEEEVLMEEEEVQVGWRWQRPCYGRHAQRLGRQVGVCRAKRGGEAHGTEARHCVRVSRRRQAALSQGDGQVLGVPVDFLTCQCHMWWWI